MKLLIKGSCVSRDMLEIDQKTSYELVGYHARSSMAVLSVGQVVNTQNLRKYLDKIESPFQKRMVEHDFSHRILSSINDLEFDAILWDLIDERFWLAIPEGGGLATFSNEFKSADIPVVSKINTHSDEFFQLWCEGVNNFMRKIEVMECKSPLILQKAFWSNKLDTGLKLEDFADERIEKENFKLQRMYQYLDKFSDSINIIEFPDDLLVIKSSHKWGVAPFHYIDSYYEYLSNMIQKIINEKS